MRAKSVAMTPEPTVPTASGPSTAALVSSSQNRRSQPVRQTRMNPRSQRGAGRDGEAGSSDQQIDIFPAVTHFSDALSALPKELVRHFTLLKEVDAKIYAPEETLFKLTDECFNAPMPQCKPLPKDLPERLQGVIAGGEALKNLEPTPVPNTLGGAPGDEGYNSAVFDQQNLARRRLFANTANHIKEMLVALEEKNHVISTANDALQKQLSRMDNVWPYLETEFCDEAKWGNIKHWAYPENRTKDGRRRDHISAAALIAAEEAAARSDARKQAVQAKKEKKQQQQHQEEQDESRKGKSRRVLDTNGNSSSTVGLGISSSHNSNGTSSKRRKTEKSTTANGTSAGEKSSSAAQINSKQSKPPGSPAVGTIDGSRKRKTASSSVAQPKKSRNGVAASASTTSSPVLGTIPDAKAGSRLNSPQPTSAPRPPAPRSRQNSTTSMMENGKSRRPSVSGKANGIAPLTLEMGFVPPISTAPRSATDLQNGRDGHGVFKPETIPEVEMSDAAPMQTAGSPRKREASAVRNDDGRNGNSTVTPVVPPTIPVATTKSGRVSKPSTPALATFQEAASARGRTSRSGDNGKETKRSKKGSTPLLQAQAVTEEDEEEDDEDAMPSVAEDEAEDANEPTYCVCNGVSYGAMVACDADGCAGEWFHLECVGLKVPPKPNVKWYCNDCKEKMKAGHKKTAR
ncbi:hypothetical protein TD95_002787 [Thielaviopsis punctulata]|uniref:Chromatin modification-related protein n=1 Tax=Thielaviopsis punctulata TaxID=72032 RepID=A0A0F4ZER2_9PEZI|nr:hypothetical protein TD95_002787 [Thielaviopsis punctulata]